MNPSEPSGCVTLAQGAGGEAMHGLIEGLLLPLLDDPELTRREDQARLPLDGLVAPGDRLALTTDSYVVDPLFFPGGDIGRLAVAGTVNDLAVGGARPLYLTCGLILEEGLALASLARVLRSMRETAAAAGVRIVTGDTKVVARGQADGLYINTAGVGLIPAGCELGAAQCRPGDRILVSAPVGDHGAAIADARGELGTQAGILSDCRPLNGLIATLLGVPGVRALRDATRGGLATVLKEFAEASARALHLDEAQLPLREPVRGLCELLGLDPLYLACEGSLVAVVDAASAGAALAALRAHPDGREAACVGSVAAGPAGRVILHTGLGGERLLERLHGDQLPRIC